MKALWKHFWRFLLLLNLLFYISYIWYEIHTPPHIHPYLTIPVWALCHIQTDKCLPTISFLDGNSFQPCGISFYTFHLIFYLLIRCRLSLHLLTSPQVYLFYTGTLTQVLLSMPGFKSFKAVHKDYLLTDQFLCLIAFSLHI